MHIALLQGVTRSRKCHIVSSAKLSVEFLVCLTRSKFFCKCHLHAPVCGDCRGAACECVSLLNPDWEAVMRYAMLLVLNMQFYP